MIRLYDSQAHLAELPELSPEAPGLLSGMGAVTGTAVRLEDWGRLAEWTRLPNARIAPGIHPEGIAGGPSVSRLAGLLEEYACRIPVRAVGEVGLDYAVCTVPQECQQEYLVCQMDFAARHQLPVILHIRKAWNDFFGIMKTHPRFTDLHLVYHNASCSLEVARQLLRFPHLYFSFSGTVTWKNARKIHALAGAVPEDRILTDSDSPCLPPAGYEFSRPWTVLENLRKLAEIRNTTTEQMAEIVRENDDRCMKRMEE